MGFWAVACAGRTADRSSPTALRLRSTGSPRPGPGRSGRWPAQCRICDEMQGSGQSRPHRGDVGPNALPAWGTAARVAAYRIGNSRRVQSAPAAPPHLPGGDRSGLVLGSACLASCTVGQTSSASPWGCLARSIDLGEDGEREALRTAEVALSALDTLALGRPRSGLWS